MPDDNVLTLRRAAQARTDFAAIESACNSSQGGSRLPTRRNLVKATLAIIFSTAALVIVWSEAFWRL
jgi:hypothetical protein